MTETQAKKEERRKHQEYLNDICAVMDTGEGRRYLWSILEQANLFRAIYGTDSEVFRQLGERNLGLRLMNEIIEANVDLYLLMQKEQIQKDEPKAQKKETTDE